MKNLKSYKQNYLQEHYNIKQFKYNPTIPTSIIRYIKYLKTNRRKNFEIIIEIEADIYFYEGIRINIGKTPIQEIRRKLRSITSSITNPILVN